MKILPRVLLLIHFLFFCVTASAADYFLDAVDGDDINSGLSPDLAWKTLDHANSVEFKAGDRIQLRAGQTFHGTFRPMGSGSEGNPIVLTSFGEGGRPCIAGDGVTNHNEASKLELSCAIRLFNQSNWWIENLEITNYNAAEENGISLEQWEQQGVDLYVNVDTPKQMEHGRGGKVGILVQAKGANKKGVHSGFRFRNLEIHGINGNMKSKHNGGIFFRVYEDGAEPMRFDDVRIEGCLIRDVDRTGLSNVSHYDDRSLLDSGNWTPNRNWVISGNTFQRTGANALIVRVADGPLMEKNLFDTCSIKGSGNAAFNFNTDRAVWRHNEFRFTKANDGDEDAGGVDSDFRSKDTLIELNYSHDNDFGMLVTGGPGRFNDGTVVRDNVFENDGTHERKGGEGRFVIRVSGSATNTLFLRNTIILGDDQDDIKVAFHKRWGTWAEGTTYRENTIINRAQGAWIDLGESRRNHFVDNNYFVNTVVEPKPDMDVYLLIGQSNMAGRAQIGESESSAISGAGLFNSEGRWVALTNPLNRFSSVRKRMEMQKLGPGYGFARHLQELRPDRTIGLVVNARGGTKIDQWKKGDLFFEEAVSRALEASKFGNLKGILWHQGEGNSNDKNYYRKLTQLVDNLREALGDPELPFVAGEVEGKRFVNTEIAKLVDYPHCGVASSEGLETQDGTHFNTDAAIELGERFSEALVLLLK